MASDSTEGEYTELTHLLSRKLQGIPLYHLPDLTIFDILNKTSRATHQTNIPSDIQLPFFLRNRTLITHPLKSAKQQPLRITRAIFFYRLSPIHQFQRYHDATRWNIALLVALLTLSSADSRGEWTVYIPPSARYFMTLYLAAVLEHHSTPSMYSAHEMYVELWKKSRFDVFEVHAAGQKKTLKHAMRRLTGDREKELDNVRRRMGKEAYMECVAPFVGSLVPGRKDQGRGMVIPDSELERTVGGMEGEENELLDALRVPLDERDEMDIRWYDEDVVTVTGLGFAISALLDTRPSDMLPVLMRMFPVGKGRR